MCVCCKELQLPSSFAKPPKPMVCGPREERPLKPANSDRKVYTLRCTPLPIIYKLSNHIEQDAIYADPHVGAALVQKDVTGINLKTICWLMCSFFSFFFSRDFGAEANIWPLGLVFFSCFLIESPIKQSAIMSADCTYNPAIKFSCSPLISHFTLCKSYRGWTNKKLIMLEPQRWHQYQAGCQLAIQPVLFIHV